MLQTQSPVTGNNPQPATSGIDRAALRVVLDKMLQSHMLPAHARESIKNRLDDKGGRWIEDIDEPGLEKFVAWLNPEIERLNERIRADAKAAADAKASPKAAKPTTARPAAAAKPGKAKASPKVAKAGGGAPAAAPKPAEATLLPDLEQAGQFIEALTGSRDTVVTFQTFSDNKSALNGGGDPLAKIIHGSLAECAAQLTELNQQGAGIFVCVNETDLKGRAASNIIRIRAVWGDFDKEGAIARAHAAAEKLPPSIEVESSPGKRHLYWLADGIEPYAFKLRMDALTPAIGADPSAKSIERVLRTPGFFHRKGEPVMVKLLSAYGERRYTEAQIIAAFGLETGPATFDSGRGAAPDRDAFSYVISPKDERLLADALDYLDPEPYSTWQTVGSALSRSGEAGARLFVEWSRPAKTFNPLTGEKDCREKLEVLAKDAKSRYPAIFTMAQSAGWDMQASMREASGRSAENSADTDVPDEVPPQKPDAAQLEWPPGVVGEIADYILASSRMPVRSFAIAGTLTAASYIIHNRAHVGYTDTPLNLYQVLIGDTGRGKEDPRKAIKRLIDACSDHDMTANISETMSSDTALLRALSNHPALLMMSDEYGMFMQSAMQGRNDLRRDLVKELMSLYGLGRNFHAGKRYAQAKDNIDRTDKPYVVVLGTTTEEELFPGMNMTSINNGSVNRNIYIYPDGNPKPNRRPSLEVPPALIEKLRKLSSPFDHKDLALEHGPGAEKLIADFGDNLRKEGAFANLWSRAEESAIRVAGVLAFCDGKVITVEHVRWAIKYVSASIEAFAIKSETGITEGVFDKQLSKALKIIRDPRHYSGDLQFSDFTRKGKMPRGKLVKEMKLKKRDLDDVLDHLFESGQIQRGKDGATEIFWPA